MVHGFVGYLLALAVGYWVLTLAVKEKGRNQLVGKVIGWIIILVAAGGLLCKATLCASWCGKGQGGWDHCGPGGSKAGCHEMMQKPEEKPAR
jgi:hypothetical protein